MKPLIKSYKPGTHIFHENDRSRELYIIQSGTIKVYRMAGNREIELAKLGKGAVLGEMALIDGKPRSASAKAIDDCVVTIIDAESFFENLTDVPGWFMTIIRMASQKIRLTNLRLKPGKGDHDEATIVIAFYYLFKKFNSGDSIALQTMHSNLIHLLGVNSHQIYTVINFLTENGFLEITSDRCSITDTSLFREYCEFLRLLIRKSFIKVNSFSPEVSKLIIATAAAYPQIVESHEPSTSISGNDFWNIILKVNLQDSYSAALVLFKDCNLLTCIKSEADSSVQKQNPLDTHNFKINNSNWKRVCLYAKFSHFLQIL